MDESNVSLSLLLKSMDQELAGKVFTKQEGCIFLYNTIKSQHYRSNVQLTILRKMIFMSPLHLPLSLGYDEKGVQVTSQSFS